MSGELGFVGLTSDKICSLILCSQRHVVIAAPGLRASVATALIECAGAGKHVKVVLDCNDEVCRLGYGEVAAIRTLVDAGIPVMSSPGLRVGVLVVDDEAWTFTPTPLSVEAERQGDETPNAIKHGRQVADDLRLSIAPDISSSGNQLPILGQNNSKIGGSPLSIQELKDAEKSLADVPPLDFNLQRQVRVFQPFIQYVEIELEGASIKRHTVALPPDLAPLAKNESVQRRLKVNFNLIGENSKVDDKDIQALVTSIRKDFTCSVKSLNGNVMLRGKQADFDKRVQALEVELSKFRTKIETNLEKEMERSRKQLVRELLPLVVRKPPANLVNGCMGEKPSKDEAKRWLDYQLEVAFPTVQSITNGVKLRVTFKDVTYQSLNKEGLHKELRKAFPTVAWEKPFKEFDTARAVEKPQTRRPKEGR